ncbi:hypothetical protein [Nitrosovibrio sp. Nv4]|uniref:hypothetical protein n=1 Tax=Nitrosovibrio sp. Nv4 TaxID=1945880 RepID=UPI000BCEFBCE|nr:hypothetical protein [Nitrosovibrio sp. Nv4]SOD41344.1 crossover junction endodeoxyribonuclease RuvC [Nitrosovibrio sp. Nv4]
MHIKPQYILGIDPGLSGALALFDPETSDIEVLDMPIHNVTVNGKKKKTLDLYALARWIDVNASRIREAIIEDPHAMPGQGVSSSFNFGFGCGVAQTIVASALIPMTLVRPATWKREMKLTADKDISRRRASMVFPQHSDKWALKKQDGRAEAVLLALYRSKMR